MSNFTTVAERLCDENAKLRDDVERMFKANVEKNGEITRLLNENIKLRELCEDILDCIEIRAAWHRPITKKMYEKFVQQARELGMEVN